MIQGRSNFVYRVKESNKFVSYNLRGNYETSALNVDVNIVENDVLDIEAFRKWRPDFSNAEFILEDGKYICGAEVEKMSKSKWNVVNPDDMIEKYGADCFRLYEMFLGPLELSKPWNTSGISGTSNFIRKLWRLYHAGPERSFRVSEEAASRDELKALHKLIKKVEEDAERLSFNTSVSAFMIAVNELTDLKCDKRAVLEPWPSWSLPSLRTSRRSCGNCSATKARSCTPGFLNSTLNTWSRTRSPIRFRSTVKRNSTSRSPWACPRRTSKRKSCHAKKC